MWLFLDRRPSVHVIQLQHDDVEREDHYLDSFHQNTENLQRYSHRSQRSTLEERTVERTYPTDAVINPAYMHDEDYVINGKRSCLIRMSRSSSNQVYLKPLRHPTRR